MAYAEKHGRGWRARWRDTDGMLRSASGFASRKAAESYGLDREAGTRVYSFTRSQLIDALRHRKPLADLDGSVVLLEGDAAHEAMADAIIEVLAEHVAEEVTQAGNGRGRS